MDAMEWFREKVTESPLSYREESDENTLFMGRLFSIIAVASITIFALRDTMLFQSRAFLVWGLAGVIPSLLFLVCSMTTFRTKRAFVVPLHLITLLGVLVAVSGYTYVTFRFDPNQTFFGGDSLVVLVTTLFFVFVFASGTRRYFAIVVLPPLLLLTAGLLANSVRPLDAIAHLSSAWVFAIAGIVASLAQERVFHNEFNMRTLARERKEELELEIKRVQKLNDLLENEIEERKAIETELERMAAMDELTEVYNRRAGMEILTQSLYLSQRNMQPLSICFVDVDNLKKVNDNFGHAEGDRLLRHVITVLKKHLRKSDYVSRIGGDEFIMVLLNCARESASDIIGRIKDDLNAADTWDGPYTVDISTGIAEYAGNHEVDPDELVKEADMEMYRAKQAKKHHRETE